MRWMIKTWLIRLYWMIQNWRLARKTVKLQLKVLNGDYPKNTRLIDDQRIKTIIVESQPGKRMVLCEDEPVCLYFPYVYFMIKYMESISPCGKTYVACNMSIGFSANPLDSSDGVIGHLPLSNYAGNYNFCLGDSNPTSDQYVSVRELVEAYINAFWKTSFGMCEEDWAEWATATKFSGGLPYVKKTHLKITTRTHSQTDGVS